MHTGHIKIQNGSDCSILLFKMAAIAPILKFVNNVTLSSPKFNDGLNGNFVGGISATQRLNSFHSEAKDVSHLEIL